MSVAIALVNMRDGSVQGHKAGCRDLKQTAHHADTPWVFRVDDKFEAFEAYNTDFIAESEANGDDPYSNCYKIDWLPCTKHIPTGTSGSGTTTEAEEASTMSDTDTTTTTTEPTTKAPAKKAAAKKAPAKRVSAAKAPAKKAAAAPAKKAAAAPAKKGVTEMKPSGKWTRFYKDGVEVGRIRNDVISKVSDLLVAS
jgi:hypothetical protein